MNSSRILVAVGLMALSPIWFWLAWESAARGKDGIAIVQTLAGLAFLVRGVVEWRKSRA